MSEFSFSEQEASQVMDPDRQTGLFAFYGVTDLSPDSTNATAPTQFEGTILKAYPFTTENMSGYMEHLDLADRDILAICGSNDFAFNAFLKGANSVDTVDTMPTAPMYAELKTAALLTLSREEFVGFFHAHSSRRDDFYSRKLYNRMLPLLSRQTKGFFGELINNPALIEGFLIDKMDEFGDPEEMNPYLSSDENYAETQSRIGEMLFHATDLVDFLEHVQVNSYDVIYTSNIFAYMDSEEVAQVIRLALSRLKIGGAIVNFAFANPGYIEAVREMTDIVIPVIQTVDIVATSTITNVPHMDKATGGDSGYRAVITTYKRS